MDTGVSQRSLASPLLLTIYLSGVIKQVWKVVEGFMAMSFADDCA